MSKQSIVCLPWLSKTNSTPDTEKKTEQHLYYICWDCTAKKKKRLRIEWIATLNSDMSKTIFQMNHKKGQQKTSTIFVCCHTCKFILCLYIIQQRWLTFMQMIITCFSAKWYWHSFFHSCLSSLSMYKVGVTWPNVIMSQPSENLCKMLLSICRGRSLSVRPLLTCWN